jgi:hydroxymethylglutaryl-CoA lyase
MQKELLFVECPRDAMQGWQHLIPTKTKIEYLNALLKVGFNTLDFGSFVSAKAIPQMADTKDVVSNLNTTDTNTKLLAIVANERGADDAANFSQIQYLGFPFSVSPIFQQLNTNATIDAALKRIEYIQDLCAQTNKVLVVYLSMGFGNPYGDAFSAEIVQRWAKTIAAMGVKIISIADTVGLASAAVINTITKNVIESLPNTLIGVHLHSETNDAEAKVQAAVDAGCVRFDGAVNGIGGCPLANNALVGNINTNQILPFLAKQFNHNYSSKQLQNCIMQAKKIFN